MVRDQLSVGENDPLVSGMDSWEAGTATYQTGNLGEGAFEDVIS